MRGGICATVFALLLVVGFLATPSLFRLVNYEYRTIVTDSEIPLKQAFLEFEKLSDSSAGKQEEIKGLEQTLLVLRGRRSAAGSGTGTITSGGVPTISSLLPPVITVEETEIASKIAEGKASLKGLENRRDEQRKRIDEIESKIAKASVESTNLYLVARALALGAIGALMAIFATFVAQSSRGEAIQLFHENSLPHIWISMAMGAIVSVVALGLFSTRQISIFHNTDVTGAPDFWRVTILCLLAGAFSERLFQAAAAKVQRYLSEEERQTAAKSGESAKSASTEEQRPVRRRRRQRQEGMDAPTPANEPAAAAGGKEVERRRPALERVGRMSEA